ncbi:hypothetical protein KRP22_006751 [Phytophthora ramorum]|nr:hypothetical protein KRP22_2118 [Phytophthora ramorum]
MWSSTSAPDADLLFPRRPRRVSSSPSSSSTRRSSATSQLEQRRRDLPPHSGSLWAFDESSTSFPASSAGPTTFNAVSEASTASEESKAGPAGFQNARKAANHGVIGSYSSGEVTARLLWNRPEREEEEREEEALPSYLSYLQGRDATAAVMPTFELGRDEQVENTSQELARALQDFIRVQMQGQGVAAAATGSCNCERRVAELEKQVQTLVAAQTEDGGSAVGDRVSTLEGRQSAFQSQLAQISKVLGVPVGKHGKSSQLKTLVQTLHEEIETKVQAAVSDVEATCVASAARRAEELIAEAATATASSSAPAPAGESSTPSDSTHQKKTGGDYDATSASGLPFSTVLNALAEEHEASLTRLSTHFDERLRLEGSQRVALEGRVRARLGELEEWLQQVEGELGGSHFEPTAAATSSSIAAMTDQLSKLQTHVAELESSWKQQREEAKEPSAKLEELSNLEGLQAQVDQQSDSVEALKENLVGVETVALAAREETRAVARTSQGLKLIVEKLMRDTGSAEELLQQYVSTITHQVASVTRQYVSVRIRDNNRLLDTTLRARVPDYVANESESFLLVRPEAKKEGDGHSLGTDVIHDAAGGDAKLSFVLRDDDEDGIRRLLASQRATKPSTISPTISPDASAVAAAASSS